MDISANIHAAVVDDLYTDDHEYYLLKLNLVLRCFCFIYWTVYKNWEI